MAYLNSTRRGIRTTQTVNPQNQKPDISEQIRTLYPEATPIITLMEKISTAGRPKSKKVQVRKYYATDFLDQITASAAGIAGNNETRFLACCISHRTSSISWPLVRRLKSL
jgi:hypothetical protein